MLNRTGGVDRIQRRDMGLVSEAYYGGRSVKVVGVGVHGAQRVCWGHDVRNRLHTCMVWERHGVCCVRCNRKRGEIVLESQGSYFPYPGISRDSLIQDTCACFHEWRHARCNSGRQLQLYSGANKSALGDWRGHRIRKAYEFWSHGVDTELGRIENGGVCERRNRWEYVPGTSTDVSSH